MSNLCSKRALEVVFADLGPEYDWSGMDSSDFNKHIASRRLGYCKTMVTVFALGGSYRMTNKGPVKAKSIQFCIKLSFSSVALCDVKVPKILNRLLE